MKNRKLKKLSDKELLTQIWRAEGLEEGHVDPEFQEAWQNLIRHEREILAPGIKFRKFRPGPEKSRARMAGLAGFAAGAALIIVSVILFFPGKGPHKLETIREYSGSGPLNLISTDYTIEIVKGRYSIKRARDEKRSWKVTANTFLGYFNLKKNIYITIVHPVVKIKNAGTRFKVDIYPEKGKIQLWSGTLQVFHRGESKYYLLHEPKVYFFDKDKFLSPQKEVTKPVKHTEKKTETGRLRQFILFDGRVYKGSLINKGEKEFYIKTISGKRVKILKKNISQMKYLD